MFLTDNVSNSMLCGAIESMRAAGTDKSRELVMEEILKATFLCPVIASMPPVTDPKGETYFPDGCKLQHRLVTDSTGRPLLLAFTSKEQMEKWEQTTTTGHSLAIGLRFLEYVDLMMRKLPDGNRGPAEGFVIDPMGSNLIVNRDMVANLVLRLQRRG